jgi:uncharacterized repeat protein (TIGR01451 family)
MKTLIARLCLIAFALAPVAPAAAQNGMELTAQVFQELEARGKDGKTQKNRVPATTVVPGTEVIYVITYRNKGAQPAEKVVINNPVPADLAYRGNSASGQGTQFRVSVDGGKNYGVLPSLRVAGADGKARPAQPADVTHLRWTLARAVPPGAEGRVSYRAVVK